MVGARESCSAAVRQQTCRNWVLQAALEKAEAGAEATSGDLLTVCISRISQNDGLVDAGAAGYVFALSGVVLVLAVS